MSKKETPSVLDSWNEYSAYIMGYLYGDACILIKNDQVAVSGMDRALLEQVMILLGFYNRYVEVRGPRSFRIVVRSRKLVDRLMSRGLHPYKAMRLRLPESIPKELRRHFIRGYFDARGHFNVEKGRRIVSLINSMSYEFLEDIRDELVTAGLTRVEVKAPTMGRAVIKFYTLDTRKLYEYLYKDANIFSHMKRDKYLAGK